MLDLCVPGQLDKPLLLLSLPLMRLEFHCASMMPNSLNMLRCKEPDSNI